MAGTHLSEEHEALGVGHDLAGVERLPDGLHKLHLVALVLRTGWAPAGWRRPSHARSSGSTGTWPEGQVGLGEQVEPGVQVTRRSQVNR